jgi:flagellar basal-body rod protein FlgB
MKLFDKKFIALEKGLNAYSKRADAIANNIANVNTPNYKRKDIQFENFLQDALGDTSGHVSGYKTNSKHIPINSINKLGEVQAVTITENQTAMRNDGNNVDIEREKVEQAKNNVRYQMATTRISNNFSILKNVIKNK